MNDDADEVIREAERAVYHTQWRIWEELALEQLAGTAGLRRVPLVPGSEVIQLVTWDGEHIGPAVRAVRQRGGRRPRSRPRLRQGLPDSGTMDADG
jgi:hypothetical protein